MTGEAEEEAGFSEPFPVSMMNSRALRSVCRTRWRCQSRFLFDWSSFLSLQH